MNQHQTAHYIEKTGAKWEYRANDYNTSIIPPWREADGSHMRPAQTISCGHEIRLWLDPITRLPSHLEPYRPDARDPGDGYRVPTKGETNELPYEYWSGCWKEGYGRHEFHFSSFPHMDYRLPASVPFPDEAEALADYVEPEVANRGVNALGLKGAIPDEWDDVPASVWRDKYHQTKESLEGEISGMYHELGAVDITQCNREWLRYLRARITELESQLARFQWRSPNQKPTEGDYDENGCLWAMWPGASYPRSLHHQNFEQYKITAWFPALLPPVESDCQRIIRQRGLTEEEVRIIRETK